jgi:hypothetical protein
VSIPLISALEGTQQGVSRRSPRRSRPPERGHYVLTHQPYGRTRQPATQQGISGGDDGAGQHYVPTTRLRSPRLRENYQGSTTATTPRYTSAMQGNFQYNNVLGSPMFAFSRHNYYVQENVRTTHTQTSSTHRRIGAIRMYASSSTTST